MKRISSLSICLIVKDEEINLPRALHSAKAIATEIVVVDTGSTDGTIAVAERFGAKVVTHAWKDDFADARNVALDHATCDWVLMLDADEEVTMEMARSIPEALSSDRVDGYLSVMVNLLHGGQAKQRIQVCRLFRNKRAYRYAYRIHEQIIHSILANGGMVERSEMEIYHFGYNPDEDQRKGRRERNLTLLEGALSETPDRTVLWYYLGIEYLQAFRVHEAESAFRKHIEIAPPEERILSLAPIAELLLRQHRSSEAWSFAAMGLNTPESRMDCLIRCAQAARLEGDFEVVQRCVRDLKAAPPNALGQVTRSEGLFVTMEASAAWEQGQYVEAVKKWRQGVESFPGDAALADQWIRHLVRTEGVRTATVGVVRGTQRPAVAAAVVGALLRSGELSLAAKLSSSIADLDIPSPYLVHGLARAGRWEDACKVASRLGRDGAIQRATSSIWLGEGANLERALTDMPHLWRTPLKCVLEGVPVPGAHQVGLRSWMMHWAEVGFLDLFKEAAEYLEGTRAERMARAALILYRSEHPDLAVELASQHPAQQDAQEVLGLCAFEAGDYEAASGLLAERVDAGDASVRVYYRGALAAEKVGNIELAERLRTLGRKRCPHSALLSVVAHNGKVWRLQ